MATIYPPVASAEYADKIVAAIARGVLKIMPHWSSRAACQSELDSCHAGNTLLPMQGRYVPTAAVVQVAGDTGRSVSPPAISASMTDRRDDGRVSGKPIIEGADGWNGPLPMIGLALASRSFGEQEARHVA